MFARVITTQVDPGGVDAVIRVAHEQLPEARDEPGFTGFYLLADREAGRLMTISLWETRDDVLAAEAKAAQLRSRMAQSAGVPVPDVDVYEVAVRA